MVGGTLVAACSGLKVVIMNVVVLLGRGPCNTYPTPRKLVSGSPDQPHDKQAPHGSCACFGVRKEECGGNEVGGLIFLGTKMKSRPFLYSL